jgi:pimeloyl-ACP methyl ester carboxylesterase
MDIGADFESKLLSTEYGRLHYLHHAAEGKTIIFIHGFAGSVRTWTRLLAHIPESLNVYLVDLLGHGDSDAPEIEYSLKMHCDTLEKLVDSEMLKKYSLFGHSYGGWLAAYFAAHNNPSGIILEDSAGLSELYQEREVLNPNYREVLIKKGMELNPREDVLRSMLSTDNSQAYLTRDLLESIESKTLILWGSQDSTVNPKYAVIFNRHIKGSKLRMIEGSRHTPHYSNPETVANALLNFLNE